MIKTILVTGFLLCFGVMSFAQDLIIGQADTVYRLGQDPSGNSSVNALHIVPYDPLGIVPAVNPLIDSDYDDNKWVADACVSYLKKDENTIISFWPLPNRIQRYEGTLKNPRRDRDDIAYVDQYQWGVHTPVGRHFANVEANYIPPAGAVNPTTVAIFLKNIYKVPDGTNDLIGFTHNEILENGDATEPRWYRIGIAFSPDLGETWTYCGEIIQPCRDDKTDGLHNLCGVPYLVVEDHGTEYFYLYFKDVDNMASFNYTVARASVNEVVSEARMGRVAPPPVPPNPPTTIWEKYSGPDATGASTWTDAVAGVQGVDVLKNGSVWDADMDMHGDAVKCTFLKNNPYMLTVKGTNGTEQSILLYRSNDGINWEQPVAVATSDPAVTNTILNYPFFMSLRGADDGHEMGSGFYLYYPQIVNGNNNLNSYYSIVRHRVNANPIPVLTKLLSDD